MFEKDRFDPLWIKYAGTNDFSSFNLEKSIPFLSDLVNYRNLEHLKSYNETKPV